MVRLELNSPSPECNSLSSAECPHSFDYISYKSLSYSDFFKKFLLANRPCVIKGVTEKWKCQSDWVLDNKPNFSLLSAKYGESEIPTSNCNEKYYNSHPKGAMKLSDYLKYWMDFIAAGYPESMPCLYLKDWHFFKEFPQEKLYCVPEYFISDWLNEFYLNFDVLNDDYRFVYMGPKGTWTPLHKDVFSSFSWSVNICGRKHWMFYPPCEVNALSDKLGNLAFDIEVDASNIEFPNLSNAKCCSLEQGPGDAVFVPSGWYHQVWNKEDTISINHNWVNGCNIGHMLSNLLSENEKVEKELIDCQNSIDWDIDCQRLLKATFGLDLKQFIEFIEFIVKKRIDCLETGTDLTLLSGDSMGFNHIKFDLNSSRNVLRTLMKQNHTFINLDKIEVMLDSINDKIDFG